MAKDFTDFIVLIFGAGERIYHLKHLRHGKNIQLDGKCYPHNNHKYILDLDRAYRIKWSPWSKLIKTENRVQVKKKGITTMKTKVRYHPIKTINELFRSKKIGLLLYQEPCTHKCSSCKYKTNPDYCKSLPEKVFPMHISRIHQPSGEMRE